MKLIIILLLISFSATAQIDTSKITTIPKMAIPIYPLAINLQGDSAYSVLWNINNRSRDTAQDGQALVIIFGKRGQSLITFPLTIPKSIINSTDITLIDNYIFQKYPKLIKK